MRGKDIKQRWGGSGLSGPPDTRSCSSSLQWSMGGQHHVGGLLSSRDRGTGQNWWRMNEAKYREVLRKTWSRVHRPETGATVHFSAPQWPDANRQDRTRESSGPVSDCQWGDQTSPDWDPTDHLYRDLKKTVHRDWRTEIHWPDPGSGSVETQEDWSWDCCSRGSCRGSEDLY